MGGGGTKIHLLSVKPNPRKTQHQKHQIPRGGVLPMRLDTYPSLLHTPGFHEGDPGVCRTAGLGCGGLLLPLNLGVAGRGLG